MYMYIKFYTANDQLMTIYYMHVHVHYKYNLSCHMPSFEPYCINQQLKMDLSSNQHILHTCMYMYMYTYTAYLLIMHAHTSTSNYIPVLPPHDHMCAKSELNHWQIALVLVCYVQVARLRVETDIWQRKVWPCLELYG